MSLFVKNMGDYRKIKKQLEQKEQKLAKANDQTKQLDNYSKDVNAILDSLKPTKLNKNNMVIKNDKIRMYEKSKITMYKHTFFFVYFFRRYTKNGKINYTIEDIERNEFKTKLFSFS